MNFGAGGQKNLAPIQTAEVRCRLGANWASSKQLATFCRVGDIGIAMKLLEKTTGVRCHIPPKVIVFLDSCGLIPVKQSCWLWKRPPHPPGVDSFLLQRPSFLRFGKTDHFQPLRFEPQQRRPHCVVHPRLVY
jgi:hypothetical protein